MQVKGYEDYISSLYSGSTSGATGTSDVNKQDFLMLLMAQLRFQDPTEPLQNEEFLAQLAQFNSMEAMMSMKGSMESLVKSNSLSRGAALVGRVVKGLDNSSGEGVEGVVVGAKILEDDVLLNLETYENGQLIGTHDVSMDTVSEILL